MVSWRYRNIKAYKIVHFKLHFTFPYANYTSIKLLKISKSREELNTINIDPNGRYKLIEDFSYKNRIHISLEFTWNIYQNWHITGFKESLHNVQEIEIIQAIFSDYCGIEAD